MNSDSRYKLEKGSKKHFCPRCDKKRFVRCIDMETGEYLPNEYGRCDREAKCGYHLNPYKNGYAKMIWKKEQGDAVNFKPKQPSYKPKPRPKKKTAFIPVSELKKTLQDYDKNIFVQNLLTKVEFPFDAEDVERVISLYRLGTNAENGAVCFPYIDSEQNIRAVQEKIFDATNHTDKSKKYHTSWLHARLKYSQYKNKPMPNWLQTYLNNDTIVSCLFGEHLLPKYPHNPVAIVEAPKTAIYGTLYFGFPEQPTNLLWLSVFNLSSLTYERCKVLKGRDVYLFPDASEDGTAFNVWSKKSNEFQSKLNGTYFKVSDLLEKLATERDKEQGNDLADYLIIHNWRKYREQQTKSNSEPKPVEIPTSEKNEKSEASKKHFFSKNNVRLKVENVEDDSLFEEKNEQTKNWNEEIRELESYFNNTFIPDKPVKLNQWSTIKNCKRFINSNLKTVRSNNGNKTFIPYLNQLQQLKQILKENI